MSTDDTDIDLDADWKPSTRPQSTMARSFSLALNDLFKIDNSLSDLDAIVSEKKRVVSSQTSELEALEARLKATEERLKAQQVASTSGLLGRSNSARASSPRRRTPLGDSFNASQMNAEKALSPLSNEASKPASRPSTREAADGGEAH